MSRKFPPSTGGMETAAFELFSALSKKNEVKLVKWGGNGKWLVFAYPVLFIRGFFSAILRRPDIIYLQDGVMAPLGWLLKNLLHIPSLITIHGLEVTHQNKIYRFLVTPFIKRQTKIVAVSLATKKEIQKMFGEIEVTVIHNGLKDLFFIKGCDSKMEKMAELCGLELSVLKESKLLHTNGRLIKRKGVAWFIEYVLPEIIKKSDKNIIYIVSGRGDEKGNIIQIIKKKKISHNVKLLDKISQENLKIIYNLSNIFIMPNIPVKNDMEGFGLVALESASCGTTVIGSRLEGIQDAIIDRKNGFLVPPKNQKSYINKISEELRNPSLKPLDIRNFTIKRFNWTTIASEYEVLMKETCRTINN